MGWRTILLTGLFRDLLARHFAAPLLVETPDLRRLVWRPDERTGILIESLHRWRGELAEKRPAVLIRPNGRHNLRLLIGDKTAPTDEGHQTYATYWVGSHTLFCLQATGAAADILATEVQRELTGYAPALVAGLGLKRLQVTEVGGPAEVEEARHHLACAVTVAWVYEEKWKLERESLKLRKVPLDVLLDGTVIDATD